MIALLWVAASLAYLLAAGWTFALIERDDDDVNKGWMALVWPVTLPLWCGAWVYRRLKGD